MMRRFTLAGAMAAASLAFPANASAYPEGALLGHTGGFGEDSCAACHFGGAQGDDVALHIDGPDVYAPGERYRFFIRAMDATADVAGFQLSVRFEDGRNAGSLQTRTDDSQTGTANDVTYASHAGPCEVAGGEAVWEVEWTAPPEGGAVILHAASVSGADDQSPIGDNVTTAERRIEASD